MSPEQQQPPVNVNVHGTTVPAGAVVITPTEMYGEIRAAREELQRLGNLIDPKLSEVSQAVATKADKAETAADLADHESRIRSLERRGWLLVGAAAAGALGLDRLATFIAGA